MKDIIRHALGVVFLFSFLLFLFLSAIQLKVLHPSFWIQPLAASGVYQQLTSGVGQLQRQIDAGMGKGVLQLEGVITQEKLRQATEENVSRILAYLQGKSKELLLFFPLDEWGLSPALLGQKSFQGISRDTKLDVALGVLGIKPDGIQQMVSGVATVQSYSRWLPLIWVASLILVLVLGVFYFLLGSGIARVAHMGFLFIVSGLIAGLIGVAGGVLGPALMQGTSAWPTWLRELGTRLLTQFFSLGTVIGFLVAGIGVVVFFLAKKMYEPVKSKEQKTSKKAQVAKFVAGVALGSLILFLIFGGLVGSLVLKFNNTSQSSKNTPSNTTALPFTMRPPQGWETVAPDKSKRELLHFESRVLDKETVAGGSVTTNAIVLVKATGNYKSLSDFVDKYKATGANTRGYRLIDASSQTVQGQESYRMEFTFLTTVQKNEITVHELDYLFFKDGVSFLAKGFAANTSWSKHARDIQSSLNSFTFN